MIISAFVVSIFYASTDRIFRMILSSLDSKRYRCRNGVLVINDSELWRRNIFIRLKKINKLVEPSFKIRLFSRYLLNDMFPWKIMFFNKLHRIYRICSSTNAWQRCWFLLRSKHCFTSVLSIFSLEKVLKGARLQCNKDSFLTATIDCSCLKFNTLCFGMPYGGIHIIIQTNSMSSSI